MSELRSHAGVTSAGFTVTVPSGAALASGAARLATEHPTPVRLQFAATGARRLTSAGIVAILAEYSTYYSSGKCTSIVRRQLGGGGDVDFHVSRSGGWMTVLAEDASTEVDNINAILAASANVG